MKSTSKRDVVVRPLRCLINGCARGAELSITAPLKLSTQWTRMLRMQATPKIRPDDLLQVNKVERNYINFKEQNKILMQHTYMWHNNNKYNMLCTCFRN